jgi:hypothetical protein
MWFVMMKRTLAIVNTAPQQSKAVYRQRRKLKEVDKIDHLGYVYNGLLFNGLATTSYKGGSINSGQLTLYLPSNLCGMTDRVFARISTSPDAQ